MQHQKQRNNQSMYLREPLTRLHQVVLVAPKDRCTIEVKTCISDRGHDNEQNITTVRSRVVKCKHCVSAATCQSTIMQTGIDNYHGRPASYIPATHPQIYR
jgi:hypothetical protein